MENPARVMSRKSEDGVRVASAGNVYRFLATSEETNEKYALLECLVEPGKGAPFHTHTREEEAFYILEGEMTFFTNEGQLTAKSGTFVHCPVHTIRGFRNDSTVPSKMLILLAPGGMEQMFVLDGSLLEEGQTADDLPGLRETECPALSAEFGIVNHEEPLPVVSQAYVHETSG